jgi:neutral trehalase
MNGEEKLEKVQVKRVVNQDGDILNRYYDAENEPRPESYLIDIEDQKMLQENFTEISEAPANPVGIFPADGLQTENIYRLLKR